MAQSLDAVYPQRPHDGEDRTRARGGANWADASPRLVLGDRLFKVFGAEHERELSGGALRYGVCGEPSLRASCSRPESGVGPGYYVSTPAKAGQDSGRPGRYCADRADRFKRLGWARGAGCGLLDVLC